MKLERIPPSEEACTEMGAFNIAFHTEYGVLSLNVEKGMRSIIDSARDGLAFFVRNAYGAPVASMGMAVGPVVDYSDDEVLMNKWLHVRPDRYEAGAFRLLLRAAKDEAVARGLPLLIARSYRRHELRGAFGRISESVGFVPTGHETLMRLPPARGG